ncbi:unnamed protein product [Cuscuta campestris]|uniref:Uncharacterized protein n=1 Tax=Cuscuta campestris TaxID=132261 RepID=A0A484KZR6_9ASTE|nr:unnamed protein product [Cuscuta campestris]
MEFKLIAEDDVYLDIGAQYISTNDTIMRHKPKVARNFVDAKLWKHAAFFKKHEFDVDKKVRDFLNLRNNPDLVLRVMNNTMEVFVTFPIYGAASYMSM